MLVEFFLFWLLLLCLCELMVTRSTAYGVSMLISVILSAVILLFLYDYDLFGSVLLALYSSVFLLLSLFILYFNRYWGKAASAWYANLALVDWVLILAILCAPTPFVINDGRFYLNGTTVRSMGYWATHLVNYDYYATLQNCEMLTVSLIHNLLYKFYVVEVLFLNVYLVFGLVLSVALLLLFKM